MVPPRIEVEWIDSEGEPAWQAWNEACRSSAEPLMIHRTCGYLVFETDEAITIAGSYRGETLMASAMVCDVIRIPKVAVRGRWPVRRGA